MLRRWRCLSCISLLLVATGAACTAARADDTATVNPNTNWGTWHGWGCSLAWWANQFGRRGDLADTVFSAKTVRLTTNTGTYTLPGLALNVARYNVGGTGLGPTTIGGTTETPNNPARLPAFKRIQGYWRDGGSADSSSASWDWTRDANQRAMMRLAQARGADIFELFSNSPPWWMCDNLSTAGGADGGENLRTRDEDRFAVYLATVARYAVDHWGVTFQSVEPFNEPSAPWWRYPGPQEGCHFDVGTQGAVLTDLRAEMNDRGLDSMAIAASDENTYDGALSTWDSLSARAKADVGQINTHGYEGGNGRRDLLSAAAEGAGKGLWNSEYGEGDASGLSLARDLDLDLRLLHPTVWCYWQPLDGGGWGLIRSFPGRNWIGAPNPKYYVLAQYTRAIRPGMMMIDGGEANTVAAYDPKAHRLVLVTVNYGTAQWIRYDLSRFRRVRGDSGGRVARWDTQTGGGEMYAPHNDTALSGKKFRCWFPRDTVQTFVINNVTR